MPIRRSGIIPDEEVNALLSAFEACTRVDGDRLQFVRLDHDELERILPDAYEVDPELSPREHRYLFRQALWNARKAGPLTRSTLEGEARRLAAEMLSEPRGQFAMWTKFRARSLAANPAFVLEWGGVGMEASHGLPQPLFLESQLFDGHGDVEPCEPVFYGHLILRTEARTAEVAAIKMMAAEKAFHAVFNVYHLFGSKRFASGRPPEAALWPGPYHFLFRDDQFLRDDWWHDPDFSREAWERHPLSIAEVLAKLPQTQSVLDALAAHPLQDVLLKVLILLQEGMATGDLNHRLLRYWSALEQLYGDPGTGNKNYRKIIDRATVAESDKRIARWKLRHISRHRNQYVHAGSDDSEHDTMCQYLRQLLSRHVNYLLFHAPTVTTHQQWIDIVDLPDGREQLEARRQNIDFRLSMLDDREAGDRAK